MKVVQAVNDKVVVEVIMEEKTTSGGIIIPANIDKDTHGYGLVVSVGNLVEEIKAGDIIIFHKNVGMAIIIDKKIMKVLTDKEVYGIIKETE